MFIMKFDFKNKNILITGGSRGIGKFLAKEFIKNNVKSLVITGSRAEIPDWVGDFNNISYSILDQSSESFPKNLIKQIKKFQQIDVLINNAGINRIDEINNLKSSDLNDILNVNLKNTLILTSEITKLMIDNNYGRIVNIASIFGTISREKRVAYSASKSGLIGATKAIALDLAKYNITANTVSPGFFDTELTRSILSTDEIDSLVKIIPKKTLGDLSELARLVMYLSSSENRYLTGQDIIIDGGYSIG